MSAGYQASNPGNGSDIYGALSLMMGKFLQNVDDMLPATVIGYDRASNTATVRPIVAVLTTEGQSVPRAQVARVPVFAFGCGQYMLNFPLKPGDLGWIKANDRDISLYMQGLKEAKPNTLRKHSFEDGVFFPDQVRGFQIDAEDFDGNAVFQSKDGSVRVSLWADKVKITTDDTWVEVRKDGEIRAHAPTRIFFDTPLVEYTGIFTTGSGGKGGVSTINGGLHATQDVTSGLVSVQHHTHPGDSGGVTGEPKT